MAMILEEVASNLSPATPTTLRTETCGAQRMQIERLAGGRLHLCDGPIDLILSADGDPDEVQRALRRAVRRFTTVLDELVAELPTLRSSMKYDLRAKSRVGQRMLRAARDHPGEFLTPMIAVAGSVADEILTEMKPSSLRRAYVNNGGDIALRLSSGESYRVGIAESLRLRAPGAHVQIDASNGVGGVATSGMQGRSFSFGIADAVTVLGRDAAGADTAATLIANSVNVEHPAIQRTPATCLDPDSDLGERLVTRSRGSVPTEAIDEALSRGVTTAREMLERGAILSAFLSCEGRYRTVGSAAQLTS